MADSKLEQQELDRVARYKRLFSDNDGKEVLKDLMSRYNVVQGTYSQDPYKMYFREGQRSVIMDLIEILDVDVIKYRDLLSEISESQNEFTE